MAESRNQEEEERLLSSSPMWFTNHQEIAVSVKLNISGFQVQSFSIPCYPVLLSFLSCFITGGTLAFLL